MTYPVGGITQPIDASPSTKVTPPLTVAAASSGNLSGPIGANYSAAIVSNVTPWLCTITSQFGTQSIQPYTADVFVPFGGTSLPYVMSVPPGGSATAPVGALTYLQVDWYVSGGGLPPGTYPISLISQAIEAAISGAVLAEFAETLIATVATGGAGLPVTVTLPPGTLSLRILQLGASSVSTVTGFTTGLRYDQLAERVTTTAESALYVPVDPTIDSQVIIAGGGLNANPIYIIAETGPLFINGLIQTLTEGIIGAVAPLLATQIAGFNAAGNLIVPTVAAAGSTVPSGAPSLLVGGENYQTGDIEPLLGGQATSSANTLLALAASMAAALAGSGSKLLRGLTVTLSVTAFVASGNLTIVDVTGGNVLWGINIGTTIPANSWNIDIGAQGYQVAGVGGIEIVTSGALNVTGVVGLSARW